MIVNGPGTMTLYSQNFLNNNLTIQSGTYINNNTQPFPLNNGVMTEVNNNITFSDGSFVVNTNSGVNSGSNPSALFLAGATFTMNTATVTNINSGDVSGGGTGGIGAAMGSGSSLLLLTVRRSIS